MRHLLAMAALAAASHAHAAIPDGLTTTCSGAFSQSWSDAVMLDCAGDLSLVGTQADVRVTSPVSITLRAGGMLQLLNLTLMAPAIAVQVDGAFYMQDTVFLFESPSGWMPPPPPSPGANLTGPGGPINPVGPIGPIGPIRLTPGGSFDLSPPSISPVPEPTTWALIAAGLAIVAARRPRAMPTRR